MHLHQVEQPRRHFIGRARPARTKDGPLLRQDLGLDKKVAEGRMRFIRGLARHDHFSITGDLQHLDGMRPVRDPDPSHFHIVFRRDHDLRLGIYPEILSPELDMPLRKQHLIALGRL